jgi:uridine kinase
MSLVEKDITQKNVEQARNHPEFLKRREREQTLVAKSADFLDVFRPGAIPYESTYLSHPDEEFSLRVRAKYGPKGVSYSGTVKDEGEMVGDSLDRMEISTEISEEFFNFYQTKPQFPDVKFLRAEPLPGLAIDFIEEVEMPQVEYESLVGDVEPAFVSVLKTGLVDMSNDKSVRKEVIAHRLHGDESLKPSGETLENFAKRVFDNMIATYTMGHKQVVVGISGMSGSGKSTAVRALQERFVETFGKEFEPVILSSDDYHRGKKWLEATYGAPWTNWDDPRVYDTAALANDIARLGEGQSILRKHFDFATEEVVFDEEITPSPFVIVEGLFAGSPDLKEVRHLHYEVPTAIATSIGRDVRRLVLENRANGSIATPEARLRYCLEVALPTYLEQQRPTRNSFAAHGRPLAERAFMLERLANS